MRNSVCIVTFLAASCVVGLAQAPRNSYLPVEAENEHTPHAGRSPLGRIGRAAEGTGNGAQPTATAYVQPGLACSNPPTATDIQNSGFTYVDSLLTSDEAASLNIPFVKLNGTANQMVLVRDYESSLNCLATDNKSLLSYGVALRTILTLDNYDGKLGLSYGAIAADATVNHKSTKVNIQSKGLRNSQFTALITQIAGKDFNVDNYPAFYDTTTSMIKLIDDQNTTFTQHY